MSYGRLWFSSSIRAECLFIVLYVRSPFYWLELLLGEIVPHGNTKHMAIQTCLICFGYSMFACLTYRCLHVVCQEMWLLSLFVIYVVVE